MSVGGGLALPILGSSSDVTVEWTTTGAALSGLSSTTENLEVEGKAFTCYFLNFGYSIDAYEVLLNYRSTYSKTSSPLDKTKGVGAMLSSSALESESTTTSISLGVGYRF